jgi:hypothetical protein
MKSELETIIQPDQLPTFSNLARSLVPGFQLIFMAISPPNQSSLLHHGPRRSAKMASMNMSYASLP